MFRLAVVLLFVSRAWAAEPMTLTLREAVEMALKQSPEIVLARLDEQKAEQAVRLARAPFVPTAAVGSGLAYSSGMPMSIEGATPSIVQARGAANIFNKPQSYKVAAARELRRASAADTAARQEEVAWRTADLYIQAQTAAKAADTVRREIDGIRPVLESVRARIEEGRELPIEGKRVELALARARYRMQAFEAARRDVELAIAGALGLDAEQTIRTVPVELSTAPTPETAAAAVERALKNSKELRALESQLVAKGFDVRSERAAWLPQADLVAQYALLGRFNNYEDFFARFQRHNGQIGVSFQLPIFAGPSVSAAASRAEAEAAQIRIRMRTARGRTAADARRAFEEVEQAQAAREVARLDLEVAREQVGILLAQFEEGRTPLRDLEAGRSTETDKWIGFYDAGGTVDRARLNLLRLTGDLLAALR